MKTKLLCSNSMLSMTLTLFVLLISGQHGYSQTITANTQGTHDGYFYSFWNDGQRGTASMTLGPGGNYSTTWNNINNFTAGKGWKVGKPDRTVCFEGSYNGGSNGFLAVYGWTKDPLIEYYVVESYGQWTPPGNTGGIVHKGSFTSDGGTYNIYTATRTNQPSIIGTATFQQFWSVRTSKRSSGTVTFKNHIDKWRSLGMNMGTTWDYQIMESEGYQSTGSSNITVKECNSCSTPAPSVPSAVITYEQNSTSTQLTASGTSLKWYTVETGGTALSTAPTPSTATVGTTVYYVGQTLNGCEGPRVSVTVNVVNTYKIFKVSSPISIDGTIDAVWSHASILPAGATKLLSGTVSNSSDLSGNAKVLWDDTYLYVLANVSDEAKINESANVYDDDGVEFYVDINNNKTTTYGANDVQYTFGWDNGTTVGVLPTGRSASGITYSAVARTGGYIVEARIPWTTLQGTPAIGQLLGMDFMINDDDDNGTRDGKLSWNAATDNAWQDPSIFGTAILQGLLPCTTPAAPSVTGSITYCQQATATALTATGTGLLWYTSSSGGTGTPTAPTPSTASTGTSRYYVSQNVSGCESSRAQIEVIVNALPSAPAVTASVSYCQNSAATTLTANGSSLKWYTQPSNGTALANAPTPSTTSAGTINYYVSQTTNGCEGPRALIAVIVNALPTAPSVTTPVTYCQNEPAVPLTANGSGLKWYMQASSGTVLPGTPTPSTSSAGTTNYYVSQTTNGCEGARAAVEVTVNAIPQAIITPSGPTTFVSGGSVELQANNGSGLSYQWYKENTQVGTGASYTATEAGSYTVKVTNGSQCTATSQAVSVNVNANQPSVITLTSPAPNSTIVGSITITVNVSDPDGGITLVEYLDGTTVIGTSTTVPHGFVWNNPSTGDHSITVKVTDSNGGVTTSSPITVTSSGVTGIWSSASSMHADVYPNPAKEELFINSDMDLSNASITVVDVLGKETLQPVVATGNGMRVDVSGLNEGIYILLVKQGNSILQKKITVKR